MGYWTRLKSCWLRPTRPCGNGPETAEAAYRAGADIAEAPSARFDATLADIDPAHREKLDTLNGVHSNAAGFRRWLEGREGAT